MRWSIEVKGSNFQQSGEHKLVTTNGPECTTLHLAAIIIFASLKSVEFFFCKTTEEHFLQVRKALQYRIKFSSSVPII